MLRHICNHLHEGGTYRYLIYDRMGFGPEAYMTLIDGMEISNFGHGAGVVRAAAHRLLATFTEDDLPHIDDAQDEALASLRGALDGHGI